MDGPALSAQEHEVTLYAEEPVVDKRVVSAPGRRTGGRDAFLRVYTPRGCVRCPVTCMSSSRRGMNIRAAMPTRT